MGDLKKKQPQSLIEKAWSMFFKKNYEGSGEVFTEVFEKDNVNDALYGRACACFKLQEYENALEDLNMFLKKDPKSYKGFHLRGLVKGSLNKPGKALSDLEKTVELNPDYADGYYDMGGCYLILKDYQNAYDCFERSLSRNNSSSEAWFGKGMASLLKKEYNKAIEYFTIAIKLDKKLVLAILGRCEAFSAMGKMKEAHKEWNRAKKLDSSISELNNKTQGDQNDDRDFDDEQEIEDFSFDD